MFGGLETLEKSLETLVFIFCFSQSQWLKPGWVQVGALAKKKPSGLKKWLSAPGLRFKATLEGRDPYQLYRGYPPAQVSEVKWVLDPTKN